MSTDEPIKPLQDPDKNDRVAAMEALGAMGHDHDRSLRALVEVLGDAEREVRVSAILSLMKIWRALHAPESDFSLSSLQEPDPDLLFAPVVPVLRRILRDDDDKYVRLEAAEALRHLYRADDAVIDILLQSARDADEELRRRAAFAFWQGASELQLVLQAAPFLGGGRAPLHDVDQESVIAVLIELLQDASRSVREYAASALSSIGPKARAAAAALVETLQDHDEIVRLRAASALASVGGDEQAGIAVLLQALRDADRLKRKAAAYSLRAMGSAARPASVALVVALQDEEPRVRARCAGALGNIGAGIGDEAIIALVALQRDHDSMVRDAAVAALGALGQDLVEGAQSRAAGFKARDSFPLFGFKPEEAPGFIFMLRDPNPDRRAYAATGLRRCGGDARAAIPDLIALLKDDDLDVRDRAAETLKSLGDHAAPALREAALSSDEELRRAARLLLRDSDQ